jgi:hypothetical protein
MHSGPSDAVVVAIFTAVFRRTPIDDFQINVRPVTDLSSVVDRG